MGQTNQLELQGTINYMIEYLISIYTQSQFIQTPNFLLPLQISLPPLMILTRLNHLQRFIQNCQISLTNSSMPNNKAYWFGTDRTIQNQPKMFKKKSISQTVPKYDLPPTPRQQNSAKRMFKKSSSTTKPHLELQPQALSVHQNYQKQQSSKIQQLPIPPQKQSPQLSAQQKLRLSSYNFRTCQFLLNQFKDKTKQSKDINSVIDMFNEYQYKLKQKSVEATQLKHQYRTLMFAPVMRAFSRILRRELFLQRAKIISFIGDDYQDLENLDLKCLTTLQLSDFIAFFFLNQIVYKFRIFSSTKIAITEKYLHEIYTRYTQQKSNYSERQQKTTDQKQDKRFVSELIIVTKTAQRFNSPMYDCFLDLLLQNVNQQKLVPYKITSLVKFLLRPENLNSVKKELQLLQLLMKKMQQSDIIEDFDYTTLKQLYTNLSALVDNNQLLIDMSLAKEMIVKIENYAMGLLPKMSVEEIYQFAMFSFKREGADNQQLGKYILKYTFSQVMLNGQTSLNPLLVMYLVSTNVDESVKYFQIDPQWEDKFTNMYNVYLVGSKPLPHLSYCTKTLTKIVKHIPSQKIRLTIIQSFLSPTLMSIIPYDHESFILQNYYLEQNNKPKMLASLFRLYEMQPYNEKSRGIMRDVFDVLEKSHVTEYVKKQMYDSDKAYIKQVDKLKMNRQWYLKTLSRYCFTLGHEELIYSMFTQSLISMVDSKTDFSKRTFSQKSSQSFSFTRFNFPLTIDQKCRDKINALLLNFISVIFELDLKLTKKQQDTPIEHKLYNNPFIILIKSQQMLIDIFSQVLTLRDTATVIHYHGKEEKVDFIFQLIRFLMLGCGNKNAWKEQSNQKCQQKYYFFYYQILKNYPIQKINKILSSPYCQQAVQKILSHKQFKPSNKINIQNIDQNNIKAIHGHFSYDKSIGQVFIDEEQANLLRERVKKGLEIHQSKKLYDKID